MRASSHTAANTESRGDTSRSSPVWTLQPCSTAGALFLTPAEAGPYPLTAIRPIFAIACFALAGCATDVVTRSEHTELLASLRALRVENARLESRVARLEQEKVVAAAPRQAPTPHPQQASASPRPVPSADALPPLTVVKLKPRKEAAPPIQTNVEIAEPPETLAQEFKNDAPAPDEADQAMAEAQFERGLSMMKTGSSDSGIAQMQQFVNDWPRHPKADNALYLSGTAFLAQKDFEHATEQFERVINQYPAGDAVLDSMLKLAECRLKLNRPRDARATWEKIVTGFPGTAAATQAQARLVSSSSTPVGSP